MILNQYTYIRDLSLNKTIQDVTFNQKFEIQESGSKNLLLYVKNINS